MGETEIIVGFVGLFVGAMLGLGVDWFLDLIRRRRLHNDVLSAIKAELEANKGELEALRFWSRKDLVESYFQIDVEDRVQIPTPEFQDWAFKTYYLEICNMKHESLSKHIREFYYTLGTIRAWLKYKLKDLPRRPEKPLWFQETRETFDSLVDTQLQLIESIKSNMSQIRSKNRKRASL